MDMLVKYLWHETAEQKGEIRDVILLFYKTECI